MLRKYGHLFVMSISFSLHSICSGPGWRGHTGTGRSLIWPGKAIPHSCTEADLVKLTNLSFWLCQNRCVSWGWRTSPTNMNVIWSWIWLLQPAVSRCREWLALFYVADMRQLQAGVIVNFHMANLLVWKGHQKEKIKNFRNMWKRKETVIWSRSAFRGAAGLNPSPAPAEDFIPDPFTLQPAACHLHCSVCLLSSPHFFWWVLLWFCCFSALHGRFLLWAEEHLDANVKPEVLIHHGCWLKKKAESIRRKKCETEELHDTTKFTFHHPLVAELFLWPFPEICSIKLIRMATKGPANPGFFSPKVAEGGCQRSNKREQGMQWQSLPPEI